MGLDTALGDGRNDFRSQEHRSRRKVHKSLPDGNSDAMPSVGHILLDFLLHKHVPGNGMADGENHNGGVSLSNRFQDR